MPTPNDLISTALAEVGYSAMEDPYQGSKYGRWLAEKWDEPWLAGPSTSIWWCCMFVSWCLDRIGQEVRGFPTYNTDLALSKNPPRVPPEMSRPGDIIIWNWNGDGATDHIGIVKEHEPGNYGRIITIEGNYSNRVAIVDRSQCWSLVSAVIRPQYGESVDDMFSDEDRVMLKRIDNALNTPADASGRGKLAAMPDRLSFAAAKQESEIEDVKKIKSDIESLVKIVSNLEKEIKTINNNR